jgi:hypothetical protein
MTEDLMDYLDGSKELLNRNVDWEKILFEEWEMTPIQEEYFINLCRRNPAFADAVTNDVSKRLTDYIEQRVKKCNGDPAKNSNVNFIFAGEQDSGKSTFMVALYLFYLKKHMEYWNRNVDFIWTFSIPETLDKYASSPHFTCIMQDEEDETEGEGKRISLNRLGNMIKRGRCSGISHFKASPALTEIKGCDYCILPFGFYKEGKQKYLEENDITDCWSRAILYAKSRLKAGGWDPLGCVFFFVGDAIKFMQSNEYISKKLNSFENLRERGGGTSSISQDQINNREIYAKELLKIAKKRGWNGTSKKALLTYIDYIENCSAPTAEQEKIAQVAWDMKEKKEAKRQKRAAKNSHMSDKESDTSDTLSDTSKSVGEFTWDEKKILDEILTDWNTKPKKDPKEDMAKKIAIYSDIKAGIKNGADFEKKYNVCGTRISQIRGDVVGAISEKLGHIYEKWLREKWLCEKRYREIYLDAASGKPDLICKTFSGKTHYVSIKCLDFSRNSFSLSYRECRPEIDAAQNDPESKVLIHVYNRHNKQAYEKFVEDPIIINKVLYPTYSKKSFIIHLDS